MDIHQEWAEDAADKRDYKDVCPRTNRIKIFSMKGIVMNNRTIDLACFKQLAGEILFDFDSVCRKHNIKYSIAYGTLLGAVRHKGYIPWDDDIDIMITRDNYEKFLKVGTTELCENHKLLSIETEMKYASPLPKIIDTRTVLHQLGHIQESVELGVYMDVFVLDPTPSSKFQRKVIYKLCDIRQRIWTFVECEPHRGANFLFNMIRKVINKFRINKPVAHLMRHAATRKRKTINSHSNLMFCAYDRKKNEIDNARLMDIVDYEFENHKVMGIRDFDWYLKKMYGDYMKLPPVKKRVTLHEYTVMFRDNQ